MYRLVRKYNENSYKYDEYLNNHITCVKRSWYEILKPAMTENFDLSDETISEISDTISTHDNSKFDDEEYYAYLDWFYPSEDCPKDEKAFNMAWNHHQKSNPHHWQYWILLEDDNEDPIYLDMPLKYVVEMCCDWHSFSMKNPESTAYYWWTTNRHKIKVSDKTAKLIDQIVEYLKDPLPEKADEFGYGSKSFSYRI